jgi:hypothetical protein
VVLERYPALRTAAPRADNGAVGGRRGYSTGGACCGINSEMVTHRHPLEYNIRYMVKVERNDRIISREIHRIKQSIPECH